DDAGGQVAGVRSFAPGKTTGAVGRVDGNAVAGIVHGRDPRVEAGVGKDCEIAGRLAGIHQHRRAELTRLPLDTRPVQDVAIRIDGHYVRRAVAVDVADLRNRLSGRLSVFGGIDESPVPLAKQDGDLALGKQADAGYRGQVEVAVAVEVAGHDGGGR